MEGFAREAQPPRLELAGAAAVAPGLTGAAVVAPGLTGGGS